MILDFQTSRSRRQTPAKAAREKEVVETANESFRLAAMIKWPELSDPTDYTENDEELAAIDFDGIPEFRADGIGCGTPEFRQQLEAYFRVIAIASRHAFAVLQFSRSELVEKTDDPELALTLGGILAGGSENLMRLARYVRAAEVRHVCAIALSGIELAAEGNEMSFERGQA
jgi:hypothetical protein